jgi:hypothetical protein
MGRKGIAGSPLCGIATWWHCDLVALRPGGIATWWHCDLVALRPGGIAFTCIIDHCRLSAMLITGTIQHQPAPCCRWCRWHCDLSALRPGGIAT